MFDIQTIGGDGMLADIITLCRIPFSLLLLVFPPYSALFAVFYLLCGITDVLDGFIARTLHTESKKGAMLDSIADILFAAVYAVRILPYLSFPPYVPIWTALIAAAKILDIIVASKNAHGFLIKHSVGNKLTGLLIFLLPLSAHIFDVKYGAILICTVATVTVIKEYIEIGKKR